MDTMPEQLSRLLDQSTGFMPYRNPITGRLRYVSKAWSEGYAAAEGDYRDFLTPQWSCEPYRSWDVLYGDQGDYTVTLRWLGRWSTLVISRYLWDDARDQAGMFRYVVERLLRQALDAWVKSGTEVRL